MKRTALLFLAVFIPGIVILLFLTGEFGDAPPTFVRKPAPGSGTKAPRGASELVADDYVSIGGKITVIRPVIEDFVSYIHDEYVLPDGKILIKSGELRGRKLDFKDHGNLIHVAQPMLRLYEKLDPTLLGNDPATQVSRVLAEARAERGVLNESNSTVQMIGNVEIHHFQNGRITSSMITESVHCNLSARVLVTEDFVSINHLLANPSSLASDHESPDHKSPDIDAEGSLKIEGIGLRADLTGDMFQILHNPRVIYSPTDTLNPLIMTAHGVLRFAKLNGKVPTTDPGRDSRGSSDRNKLFVPRGEIYLEDRVVIDLPIANTGASTDEVPRIQSDTLRILIENLRAEDPGDSGLVGQAIRQLNADGNVRISSEQLESRSDALVLTRSENGTLDMATFGSPRMLLFPGREAGGSNAYSSFPANLTGKGTDAVIFLTCRDNLLIRGSEIADAAVEGGMTSLSIEKLRLRGEARIERIQGIETGRRPTFEEVTSLLANSKGRNVGKVGLSGESILIDLATREDGSLQIERVQAIEKGLLFDEKTEVWGDHIIAVAGPTKPSAPTDSDGLDSGASQTSVGPITVFGNPGLKTRIRSESLLEATSASHDQKKPPVSEEDSILEVTCSDSIVYRPATRLDKTTAGEIHRAVFTGNVSAVRTPPTTGGPDDEPQNERLDTDLLVLDLEQDPTGRLRIRTLTAKGNFTATTPKRQASGDELVAHPDPPSFRLVGSPARFRETDKEGVVSRRLEGRVLTYDSTERRFVAEHDVDAFFVLDPSSKNSRHPSPTSNSRSSVQISAQHLFATFSPADPEKTTPSGPGQIESFKATGEVEVLRWDRADATGEPIRMTGHVVEAHREDKSLIAYGDERGPARILKANSTNPEWANEVRGPQIHFFQATEDQPDRVLIPHHGLVRIVSGAGESFYRVDRLEPKTVGDSEGVVSFDSVSESGRFDQNQPAVTEVTCKGPMTLLLGQHVRFEEKVVVRRFQPPGEFQAETRCDLLTLYFESSPEETNEASPFLDKISRVIALGSVHFTGRDREGSGERLIWIPGKNLVTLKGEPAKLKIRFSNGRVMTKKARLIEYNFETDHLRAYELDTKIRTDKSLGQRGRQRR